LAPLLLALDTAPLPVSDHDQLAAGVVTSAREWIVIMYGGMNAFTSRALTSVLLPRW